MHIIAKKNEKLSYRVMGRKVYLFSFAWLGASIHELGHAFFTPNSNDDTLSPVSHSYNPTSTYQRIGNFFIGIGLILFGAILLNLVSWLLFWFWIRKNVHLRNARRIIFNPYKFQ